MDEWLGLGLGGYYYMGDPRVGVLLTLACGGGGGGNGSGGGSNGAEGGSCTAQVPKLPSEQGLEVPQGLALAQLQALAQGQGLAPVMPPVPVTQTLQTLSLALRQSSTHIKTICCANIPPKA